MKKHQPLSQLTLGLILSLALSGCGTMQQAGTKTNVTNENNGGDINQARMEAWDGPKARIAVAKFTDKTHKGWYNNGIGQGMADQLSTALVNTGRYIVLERQNMDSIIQEQSFGQSGLVKRGTAARMGRIEGAELLIVAAVTEFEGNSGGGGGGFGGGGFGTTGGVLAGVIGGIASGYKKAHMAIDLRVIDAESSRVLAATSVEGESTDVSMGGAVGGFFGGGALGGALGSWKNTPVEKALRQVINDAVKFVVSKTPTNFYRHGQAAKKKNNPHRRMVKSMQQALSNMGYDVGVPDGIAGPRTASAIRMFQQENGLSVTGKLDEATKKALRATLN